MLTVADALTFLESIAPSRWAFGFDNVGLLVGSRSQPLKGIAFALDPTEELVNFGHSFGANLLISHHPILWNGTKSINDKTAEGRMILSMIKGGFNLVTAHTNWDCAPGGISDTMAIRLGLTPISSFGAGAEVAYSKIVTFTPAEYVDPIIDVMANAGAGLVGNYRRCGFHAAGLGTFEPLPGSDPYVGRIGKTDQIEEHRIEMICPSRLVDDVVAAIVERHPYEQPAFDVITLRPLVEQPLGRLGILDKPMPLAEFRAHCDAGFNTKSLAWGDPAKVISKVAVVGGAGDDEWSAALEVGADAFVTGEIRHHVAKDGSQAGIAMLSCGHFATEHPGMENLCELFKTQFPDVHCKTFVPESGSAARPL
jgi:dinuclear metal center YbgI/SA1388 family protein